ncbi:hypothetical protein KI387_020142, partial [Taxus chinensis]
PREVGPHRYYTRSQARIQTDLNTGSGSRIMDRREDSHTPPRRERPDPDALFSAMELSFQHKGKQVTFKALKYTLPHQMVAKSMIVWDQEPSREDIYTDFSLHISTDQQGGDEECGKFEAYMRTLVSLMTTLYSAHEAIKKASAGLGSWNGYPWVVFEVAQTPSQGSLASWSVLGPPPMWWERKTKPYLVFGLIRTLRLPQPKVSYMSGLEPFVKHEVVCSALNQIIWKESCHADRIDCPSGSIPWFRIGHRDVRQMPPFTLQLRLLDLE